MIFFRARPGKGLRYRPRMIKMIFKCIVINGKFLEQKLTGVQRFALELTKALDSKAGDLPCECILAISPKTPANNIPLLNSPNY